MTTLHDHLTDYYDIADLKTSDMRRVVAHVGNGGNVHWTDLNSSGAAWGYKGFPRMFGFGECCADYWADPLRRGLHRSRCHSRTAYCHTVCEPRERILLPMLWW